MSLTDIKFNIREIFESSDHIWVYPYGKNKNIRIRICVYNNQCYVLTGYTNILNEDSLAIHHFLIELYITHNISSIIFIMDEDIR